MPKSSRSKCGEFQDGNFKPLITKIHEERRTPHSKELLLKKGLGEEQKCLTAVMGTMQECEEVFVLLGDEGRVSRHFRSIWLLEHLFRPVSSEETITDDGSFTILSATRSSTASTNLVEAHPQHDEAGSGEDSGHDAEGREPLLRIGPDTQVTFFSPRYCLVFMLDVSPSMMTVDSLSGRVLYDELLLSVSTCFRHLAQPFRVPGSSRYLQPELFVSVLAQQKVAKHQPVQSVLIQGAHLTLNNIESVIAQLEDKLFELENSLAEHATRYHNSPRPLANDPDCGLVALLRSGLVGLQLLPDGAADSLILVTDSVCGMPDGAATEVLMTQLRNFDIAFSCFQLGSEVHYECSYGFIPNTPLLQFIPLATSGAYFANLEKGALLKETTPGDIDFYHRTLLGWTCQYNSEEWHQHYSAINIPQMDRFWSELPLVPISRRRYDGYEIKAPLISVVGTRIRQGYQLANIAVRKRHEGGSRLEVKLQLPWKDRASICYEVSADYPLTTYSSHVDIYIEGSYDFVRDVFEMGNNRQTIESHYRLVVVRRFLQHIRNLEKYDLLLGHLLSFSSSPVTYTLVDNIRHGSSVFYLPPNSSSPVPSSGVGSRSTGSGHGRRSKDGAAHHFTMFWMPVLSLEISVWHSWFHVHRLTAVLLHDSPLRDLHYPNLMGRYAMVQCRQAAGRLVTMLREWSSFVLLESYSYVRFIYADGEGNESPTSFCLVRVSPHNPFMVLRLAFLVGTAPSIQQEMVRQLKEMLCNLSLTLRHARPRTVSPVVLRRDRSVLRRSTSRSSVVMTSVPCVKLLSKNYEKVLVRYEKVPPSLFSVGYDEELAATSVDTKQSEKRPNQHGAFHSSPLHWGTEDLSHHLCQQRWIWSVEEPSVGLVPLKNVSAILAALVQFRMRQGFSLAWSNANTGIVTMTCELTVVVPSGRSTDDVRKSTQNNNTSMDNSQEEEEEDDIRLPCLLQYLLFPPLGREGGLASASLDASASPSPADVSSPGTPTHILKVNAADPSVAVPHHLRIATEVWVEPQQGHLCELPVGLKHLTGLTFDKVADELVCDDLRVISLLSTYEDLLLMCEFPNTVACPESVAQPEILSSIRQHKPVAHVPHLFNLPLLVGSGNVVRINLSGMRQSDQDLQSFTGNSNGHQSSPSSLLFDLYFNKLKSLNDHRILLSSTTSSDLLAKLLKLPAGSSFNSQSKMSCNLSCFIRSRDLSSLYITLLPASLSDAQHLQAFEDSGGDGEKEAQQMSGDGDSQHELRIPVFIIQCSQTLPFQPFSKLLSEYLDFTFPSLENTVTDRDRKTGWLFDAIVTRWADAGASLLCSHKELSSVCTATQELFLGAYIQSVFASLDRGLHLLPRDVDWAIGLCDLHVNIPVDLSTFLSAVCSHCRIGGAKGKGSRQADSPYVGTVSALPMSFPTLPGITVSDAKRSRLDRLTQCTLEHALSPSDPSLSRVSDWSQESDTATSDTDHSSTFQPPTICRVHQAAIQKQFDKELDSSFSRIACLPKFFYYSARNSAQGPGQPGRKRTVKLKRRSRVVDAGAAADIESVSSDDSRDDNKVTDGTAPGGEVKGNDQDRSLVSGNASEVDDLKVAPTSDMQHESHGEVKEHSLTSSQQFRELKQNAGSNLANGQRRRHCRRRHSTLCADGDSSSESSDGISHDSLGMTSCASKDQGRPASRSAKIFKGLTSSSPYKSPSLYSSLGSGLDDDLGSDEEAADDSLKPLFMSLACSVTAMTGAGAAGTVGMSTATSSTTAPGHSLPASTVDSSSEKQRAVSIPVLAVPTCYEEIMRELNQRRDAEENASSRPPEGQSPKPPMALRPASHGISIDMYCQMSSLLDDSGPESAAAIAGGLLSGLAEARILRNAPEVNVTPAAMSPATPLITEEDITPSDVFFFTSPRRSSSIRSIQRPSGIDVLPTEQGYAIEATKEKLLWLLKDEIVSAAHRSEPLLSRTLEMVTRHVIHSRPLEFTSCRDWHETLRFVSDAEDRIQRFVMEFENLRLPGYELHKLDDFYYYTLSRNTSSQGRSRACSNRSASFDVAGSQVWLADSSFNDSMSLNHSRSNSDAVPVQVPGSGLAVEVLPVLEAPRKTSDVGLSTGQRASSVENILEKSSTSLTHQSSMSSFQPQTSSSSAPISPPTGTQLLESSTSSISKHIPRNVLRSAVPLASPFFAPMNQTDTFDNASVDNVSVTTDYGYGYQPDYLDMSSNADSDADGQFSGMSDAGQGALYRSQRTPRRTSAKKRASAPGTLVHDASRIAADYVPEFWLILRIYQNRVDFFHQYRNSEALGSRSQELVQEICATASRFVRESEKTVNQWLLLVELFETKICSPLLVANTSLSSITGWQTSQQLESSGPTSVAEEKDSADRSPSVIRGGKHFMPGMFQCPCQHSLHIPIHPRLSVTHGQSAASAALQIVHGALAYFAVSNRDKLYVYREHTEGSSNSSIFYLRVFESLCSTGGGSLIGSTLTSRAPSMASLYTPDMRSRPFTPAIGELDETGSIKSLHLKRPASAMINFQQMQSVMVDVHGIHEPGPAIKQELFRMLSKKLEEATLKSMTEMLHRNDRSTIYPPDVEFIQQPGLAPQKFCRFALPDLPCRMRHTFMYYLRQHLLQHMIIPRYAEGTECHFLPFTRPEGPITHVTGSAEDFVFLFNSQRAVGLGCVAVRLIDYEGASFDISAAEPACSCIDCPRSVSEGLDIESLLNVELLTGGVPEGLDGIEVSIWELGTIGIDKLVSQIHRSIRFAAADFVMEHFLLFHSLAALPEHIQKMARESLSEIQETFSDVDRQSLDSDSMENVSANSSLVVIRTSDLPSSDDVVVDGDLTMNRPLSLSKEQLALLADSQREVSAVASGFGDKLDDSLVSNRRISDACERQSGSTFLPGHSRSSSVSSQHSRIASMPLSQWHEKADLGLCGSLHPAYSRHVLDLIVAGCRLSSTSFFKMDFVLPARSMPTSSLQDLMQLVNDSGAGVASAMFRLVGGADNTLLEESSAVGASESVPYYAPFNPSRVALKQPSSEGGGSTVDLSDSTRLPTPPSSYLLIARNYDQWRFWRARRDSTNVNVHNIKKELADRDPPGQNFKSFDSRRSYQPADNVVHAHPSIALPRQQLIAMSIRGKRVELYAYNITQEVMTRLKDKLLHVSVWQELRSAFQSSLLAQKMGLFHHSTLACIPSTGQEHFGLHGHFMDMELIVKETVAPTKEHVRQQQSRWQRSTVTGGAGHLQNYESLFYGSLPPMPMDKKPFATEADPVKRHGLQAQEMFSIQRRASGRQMQLSDLFDAWQRRQSPQAPVNEDLLEVLKKSCRLYHYCASPLLFDVLARKALLQSVGTGEGGVLDDMREAPASPTSATSKNPASEPWTNSLRSYLVDRYIEYLEAQPSSFTRIVVKTATHASRAVDATRRRSSLDFRSGYNSPMQPRSPNRVRHRSSVSPMGTPSVHCLQKTTAGGVILIELRCKTSHFVVKLYAVEGSIIQPRITSNKQISTLFMQECSRMKDFIHVHSFTYDFHLRTAVQFLRRETSLLPERYDAVDMLTDFLLLRKQPKFGQNRIIEDEINMPIPATATPEQLFTYMLAHAASFRMDVLEHHEERTTSTLPGCGSQVIGSDRIKTSLLVVDDCFLPDSDLGIDSKSAPDFHRCLLIMLPQAEADVQHISCDTFSGTGGYEMTLKFYLLLSSLKYPFPTPTRAATFRKPDRSALHASKDESFLHMEGEDGTQQEATFQHTVQQQWLQMGYAPGMSPDPVATPGQEKSGERLTEMDLFMNSQMKQIGSRLRNVVSRASQQCRRDTLWKRMLYGLHEQPRRHGRISTESTENMKWEATITACLSFDELEELIPKVTCVPLNKIDANLTSLLAIPPASFPSLIASLKQRFADGVRVLKTSSGNVTHVVIINSEWQDMVVLLTLDSNASQVTCQAIYRRARSMAPPPTIETNDGWQGDADHLHIETVVNILAFSLWTDLLSN